MNALQEINLMVKAAQVQVPTPSVVDSWSDAQKRNYLLSKPLTIPKGYTAETYKKHLNDILRQGPRLENWPSKENVLAAYQRSHAVRNGSFAQTAKPKAPVSQPARWSNGQMKNPYTKAQIAQAPSTKMMENLNRQLTEEDADKESRRRRPGMDQQKARALAPLVAKNYRLDANVKWTARTAKTNQNIASTMRKGPWSSFAISPVPSRPNA